MLYVAVNKSSLLFRVIVLELVHSEDCNRLRHMNSNFTDVFHNRWLIWWNLGPREDEAQEVRQWSVCPFESQRKKKRKRNTHTIQCVTVTAIHSTEQ